ncbi:MAG: hypothetical protein JXA10_15395 [Anaerolineae bacterium]|nr:hypothetical protein [Anaerolineae bacterium]
MADYPDHENLDDGAAARNEFSELGSLIRRVLDQNQEIRTPDDPPPETAHHDDESGAVRSPIPGYNRPAQPDPEAVEGELPESPVSPIRPTAKDHHTEPQPPLKPTVPDRRATSELSPREQMQRAEEALIRLREKMGQVAAEFAAGKINQDQFDAIYGRYSEQRDITERLLARDPQTNAWQSVVRPGHTQFLRDHYEARVISYAIYAQETAALISVMGPLQIKPMQAQAVLLRLKDVSQKRGQNPGPAKKMMRDGRCVLFVPGQHTVAAVIFSREPAGVLVARIVDLHDDFERANQHAIQRGDYATGRMVFPHRALFEDADY